MNFNKKLGKKTVSPIGIGTWLMGGGFYLESKTTYAIYGHEQECVDAMTKCKNKSHLSKL